MAFHDLPERGRGSSAFLPMAAKAPLTFRVALGAVAAEAFLAAAEFWFAHRFRSSMIWAVHQSRMAASLASLAQQGSDTASLSARNGNRL